MTTMRAASQAHHFQLPLAKTVVAGAVALLMAAPAWAAAPLFDVGNLIVSVEGNGVWGAASGSYVDNQAAPLTLFQFSAQGTSSASYVNALVLPQTASGKNAAVSGEYGSSSEGGLQLTGDGRYLTIMGYGVNAAAFNANPTAYGTLTTDPSKPTALGQSGSLQNAGYTPVARVAVLINGAGQVDSSTALYGVYNGNNPRSVYSANGSAFYVSGQGTSGDTTGGVFYAAKGSHGATAITGLDTSGNTAAQDTRSVQAYNGQLYVSADSKQGSGSNRDFIGTLGAVNAPPTTLANGGNGASQLAGFAGSAAGKLAVTATNGNGLNASGKTVNLSPEAFYFASANTLYVADSGAPKNNSANTTLGDGGLQKWTNSKADGSGTWTLDYTVAAGLNLVANTAASGTTGLLGLTGKVLDNGQVELYATNYTVGDTDHTYLYGISDTLSATSKVNGESFTQLAEAPADSTFKGVSFAPTSLAAVPEPAPVLMFGLGLAALALVRRRQSR